jgi:antitoxin StbD
MQDIHAKKVVGLTDLREPRKVIEEANGEPVAIMNRNEVEGYFVPASSVNRPEIEPIAHDEAMKTYHSRKNKIEPGLDYLKDK